MVAKKQTAKSAGQEISIVQKTVQTLQHMRPQLLVALPPQVDVDRFIRTASNAIQNHPELADSNKSSLFMACQRAAQDGLVIDDKEAALGLFNKKNQQINKWEKHAQYMPMTAGILKLARNSGEISTIYAYPVFEGDDFEYELGSNPHIMHKPCEEPGDFRLAYAVAKLKDGSVQLQVMTKAAIEKVRKSSKSGSHKETGEPIGIWKAWYPEMACKTVLRKLCKYLPSSTDLDGVLAASDEQFDIRDTPSAAPAAAQPERKSSGKTRAEAAILGDDEDIAEGEIVDDKNSDAAADASSNDSDPI